VNTLESEEGFHFGGTWPAGKQHDSGQFLPQFFRKQIQFIFWFSNMFSWCAQFGFFFLFFPLNDQGLGTEIDPDMALPIISI